jgi:hypothetical protein
MAENISAQTGRSIAAAFASPFADFVGLGLGCRIY